MEFSGSKGDDAWLYLKIDRNPNITVLTRKGLSSLDSWGFPHNYTGVLTSLNKVEFRMAIPAVTREYTPGSWRNSRNSMRHSPRWEMRLDSPALHAEQSHIPNQTCKEPRFSWWNSTESPGTLSQNEMNTDASQEYKIARCTPNPLEMNPISPSLAP